jgi:hypothetical protein
MSFDVVKVMVMTEVKLRMRRLSTLVVTLAVIALSWSMVPAPESNMALISINDARVLLTSSALAFGTVSLAAIVFGLGSFYLARGRASEDVRSGTGSVIAASQIGNGVFIFSRWLGGVTYILALVAILLSTTMVLHAIRGHGPIEVSVYLQVYGLLLVPMVFFGVSFAILFDSIPWLMGKLGDVLFFVIWMFQLALMAAFQGSKAAYSPLLLIDFSGLATSFMTLQGIAGSNISVGMSEFNKALPAVLLPQFVWPIQIILMRFGACILAMLPLLPAMMLFHRYSPDRVKVSTAAKRRSPLTLLNSWLRPLSRMVKPLFVLAAKMPGISGQVLADIALTLVTSPLTIVLLFASVVAAFTVDSTALPVLMIIVVVYWGILISDISTRDYAATAEDITDTVRGGKTQRFLRQWLATNVLGFLFMGAIAFRWSAEDPKRALAVISGIVFLSTLASAFGRFSRTPRTFIALFLFAIYIALNGKDLAIMDLVGFNGSADFGSMAMQMMVAGVALVAGYLYNRQQLRF